MQIYFRHQLRHSSPVLARGVPRLRIVWNLKFLSYLRSPGMCRFLSRRELPFAQEVGTQFGGLQVYLCICTCVFVFVYLQLRRFSIRTNTFWKFEQKEKEKPLWGRRWSLQVPPFLGWHVVLPRAKPRQFQKWKAELKIEHEYRISNIERWKAKHWKKEIHKCNLGPFLLEQWKMPWKDNSRKCAHWLDYQLKDVDKCNHFIWNNGFAC